MGRGRASMLGAVPEAQAPCAASVDCLCPAGQLQRIVRPHFVRCGYDGSLWGEVWMTLAEPFEEPCPQGACQFMELLDLRF